MTINEIIEAVDKLTVLELSQLVKTMEKKYGVSAAAPAAAAAAPAAAVAAAGAPAEEQTEFEVILNEVGAEKIKVIKVVREVTGLGLKEAKDLVDGAPKPVKEAVSKDEAQKIAAALKEAGATAEIK